MDKEQSIPSSSIHRVEHAPPAMFMWSRQTLLRYWGPTILWLTVVALFSTANAGASNTGGILEKVFTALHIKLSAAQFAMLHFGVRKSAHFLTYMTLGFLAFRTFRGPRSERRHRWNHRWAELALALCLFTASADEFHQKFTPGRGASPKDVLLDMTGALFSQLFIISWTASHANGRRKFWTLD